MSNVERPRDFSQPSTICNRGETYRIHGSDPTDLPSSSGEASSRCTFRRELLWASSFPTSCDSFLSLRIRFPRIEYPDAVEKEPRRSSYRVFLRESAGLSPARLPLPPFQHLLLAPFRLSVKLFYFSRVKDLDAIFVATRGKRRRRESTRLPRDCWERLLLCELFVEKPENYANPRRRREIADDCTRWEAKFVPWLSWMNSTPSI